MGLICDVYPSPLGLLRLCSDGTCLTAVTFAGQKHELHHIPEDVPAGTCPVLEQTKQWLQAYFSGQIPGELPPFRLSGTPFQCRVWELLTRIPYGQTVSYGELAGKLRPNMSAQAVGGAVGKNPISILIPCHRVIGADGSLTGYAGGTERKAALLAIEKGHLI